MISLFSKYKNAKEIYYTQNKKAQKNLFSYLQQISH